MEHNERLRVLAKVKREWSHCERCPLGAGAFRHVLYELPEGESRCDVLFIGEGPGRAEDSLGKPFIGPSGKFLRDTIEAADPTGLLVGFSNLIACRPILNGRDRPPEPEEIGACSGRLIAVVQTVEPLAIVGLGRVPERFLRTILDAAGWEGERAYFPHPAYLLRQGRENAAGYPEYRAGFEELFMTVRGLRTQEPNIELAAAGPYDKYPGRRRHA